MLVFLVPSRGNTTVFIVAGIFNIMSMTRFLSPLCVCVCVCVSVLMVFQALYQCILLSHWQYSILWKYWRVLIFLATNGLVLLSRLLDGFSSWSPYFFRVACLA